MYFERSDEGNASEASNLIKRAQQGCVLLSEARKCIASKASWYYSERSEEGIASEASNLTIEHSEQGITRKVT